MNYETQSSGGFGNPEKEVFMEGCLDEGTFELSHEDG